MSELVERAYRCREVQYAPPMPWGEYDSYDYRREGEVRVIIDSYPIIKRTPKGMWIDLGGQRRFVLLTATKKFACETVEEAKVSFVARKQRQISIYTARIKTIERALVIAKADKYTTNIWML